MYKCEQVDFRTVNFNNLSISCSHAVLTAFFQISLDQPVTPSILSLQWLILSIVVGQARKRRPFTLTAMIISQRVFLKH